MLDAKSVSTPMALSSNLSLQSGSPLKSITEYRQVVAALQYLQSTHPNISFCVNKLSQYMHKPTNSHLDVVNRLLWYLNGTQSLSLFLCRNSPLALHVFSDVDWAGNKDDSTSTTTYVIFFGHNPISWSSRKRRSISWTSIEAEYCVVAHTTSELC